MNRSVPPFLSLAPLTVAMLACVCSSCSIPTDAPLPPVVPTAEPLPENPSLGDTWTRLGGAVMVYVPGGKFTTGSTDEEVDHALALCNEDLGDCERDRYEDEQPAHTVVLDAYWIDRTEVTNGQYHQCVAAGVCEPPKASLSYSRGFYYGDSAYDDYPVTFVDWHRAEDYCEWAGGRLPTEAEWEVAARGPEPALSGVERGRVFPWGNTFDGTRLNHCDANCEFDWADASFDDGYADAAPVGSYPEGASWCGALDMAGNVWEWIVDRYGEYPSRQQVNPTGPSSGEERVVRGGSWELNRDDARCARRNRLYPHLSHYSIGFRCVSPAGSSP